MKIDAALNMVLPLLREDGTTYGYIHSIPISTTVYDAHFKLMIRAYGAMIGDGSLAVLSAHRYLKDAAEVMAPKDGRADILYLPLLNEIERLSAAIISTPRGWETIPLQQAISQNMLEDPDDAAVALNSIVFFTLAWRVLPKAQRANIPYFLGLLGAATSSLNSTDWIASLATPTAIVSSGEIAPPVEPPPAPAQDGTITLTV